MIRLRQKPGRQLNVQQADAIQKRARPATWDDALLVCKLLNDAGCNYCLHGGFALAHWLSGEPDFKRSANIERADSGEATVSAGADSFYKGDVDIAIPRTITEFEKLRTALGQLPEKKILHFPAHILAGKLVIRLIEDFSIDIITNIGGIEFEFLEILPVVCRAQTLRREAPSGASESREAGSLDSMESKNKNSITIPMVSADCLVRIKQFVIRRDTKHIRDLDRLKSAGYNGNFVGRRSPGSGGSPSRHPVPDEKDIPRHSLGEAVIDLNAPLD